MSVSPGKMPGGDCCLPGRNTRMFPVPPRHHVLETPMLGPWPDTEVLHLAMGCFWGAERLFWQVPGVVVTAAGYMGGATPHPTYDEVCSGRTGHTETVLVAYDPQRVSTRELLALFWQSHDPTQTDGQGNDIGTQYRSAIFWTTNAQFLTVEETLADYQQALNAAGFGPVVTQVASSADAGPFYYAEPTHQQYLAKNPNGYCGIGGTGVSCPLPRG